MQRLYLNGPHAVRPAREKKIERLGAVPDDVDVVRQVVPPERVQRELEVGRVVFNEQDLQ